MKTLCVAVVVLSVASVCQSASLACQKLLEPLNNGADVKGEWHIIAMSAEYCLVPMLLNTVLWPSIQVDVTATEKPNIYELGIKMNSYGFCYNDNETFFFEKNKAFSVDSKNSPIDSPSVLLQTVCPDCLVVKHADFMDSLTLYSRRKTVKEAEMKEFEAQAECLGWEKPQLFNKEHDYETCQPLDDDSEFDSDTVETIYERLDSMKVDIAKCFIQFFISLLVCLIFGK